MFAATFVVAICTGIACDSGDGGGIGAPCDTADDCAEGLICDVHGDAGTCQEPHDHGESDSAGETDSDTTG